jgi:hypothetical protein
MQVQFMHTDCENYIRAAGYESNKTQLALAARR